MNSLPSEPRGKPPGRRGQSQNNLKIPKIRNASAGREGGGMYCSFKRTVLPEAMIENVKHFYLNETTYEVIFQICNLLL